MTCWRPIFGQKVPENKLEVKTSSKLHEEFLHFFCKVRDFCLNFFAVVCGVNISAVKLRLKVRAFTNHCFISKLMCCARAKKLSKNSVSQCILLSFFLSNYNLVSSALISYKQSTWNPTTLKSKQEVTPQLYCTSNGVSSDVLCYLRWMLSVCLLWAVCLSHLPCLSLLWCAGSADKQRCETLSAQANLLRMKLLPLLCQPGAHGQDDGKEVVRGTNSSRLYLDSQLSEVTGVVRDWEARHFQC